MAQVVGNNQVKLNNGQVVTAATGGWYDGQQFWNGSLSNAGQFNPQNNQAGQQGGAAPVQSQADAAYLVSRGDTTAGSRVVNQQAPVSNPGFTAPVSSPGASFSGINNARPAIPDFQGIYDTAIAAGTKDYQTQFDTLTEQMRQREIAKNEAVAKIADNPYLSEATMSGRIAKLNNKYNADTQVLTGQQNTVQNKITSAKADAQVKLSIAQNQYNIEDQQYQQNLQLYSNMLSAGGFVNASPQDIANASVAMGVPTSMLQSIIAKQKKDAEVKPTLQTVDDGTNQYVVAIDDKGNVINKSVIGTSKPAKATGAGIAASAKQTAADVTSQVYDTFTRIAGAQGYVSKEDWAKMKSAVLASGAMTAVQFDKEFESFKNPSGADYGYVYN